MSTAPPASIADSACSYSSESGIRAIKSSQRAACAGTEGQAEEATFPSPIRGETRRQAPLQGPGWVRRRMLREQIDL